MADKKKDLTDMEQALDQLLDVACSLSERAQEGAADELIIPLQERQEALVSKLVELDTSLQLRESSEPDLSVHRLRIQEKLTKFQKLNKQFIEQMRQNKTLILFDAEQEINKILRQSLKKKG